MNVLRSKKSPGNWINNLYRAETKFLVANGATAMPRRSKSASAGPTQRQLRVGEDLRHQLASILARRETHIPELDQVSITVSEVSVSPDLSHARVYVMTLGGIDIDKVLTVLNQVAPFLRHHLANKVHLRRLPVLKFVADESYDTADRMARLFSSIQTDR